MMDVTYPIHAAYPGGGARWLGYGLPVCAHTPVRKLLILSSGHTRRCRLAARKTTPALFTKPLAQW
jgi:hypothetical protein